MAITPRTSRKTVKTTLPKKMTKETEPSMFYKDTKSKNPLYRTTSRQEENEKKTPKETKREERVNREQTIVAQKETKDKIDDKIETLGKEINENNGALREELKEGFNQISKQLALTRELFADIIKEKSKQN